MKVDKIEAKRVLLERKQKQLSDIQCTIVFNRKKLTRLFEERKKLVKTLKTCTPKTPFKEWEIYEQMLIPEVQKKEFSIRDQIVKLSRE